MRQNVFSENEYIINLEKLKYFFEITTEAEMKGNHGVLVDEHENRRTYDFCTEEKTSISGRITTFTKEGLVTSILLEVPIKYDAPDNQVELNTIITNYDAIMNSCINVLALKARTRPIYEDVDSGLDDPKVYVDELLQKACNAKQEVEAVARISTGKALIHCILEDKDDYIWWLDLGRYCGYYTDEILEDCIDKGFLLTLEKTFYRPSGKKENSSNLDKKEDAKEWHVKIRLCSWVNWLRHRLCSKTIRRKNTEYRSR